MKNLLSISMDGPNVNLKFLNDFQQEHAELHGGRQLINVGSCGLHTLHNSFKTGFSTWNIEKLLRAMHFLFHNVPARREDFTKLTASSLFPLPFCGHRWVENLPVAERAIEVWPKLKDYVKAVHRKELPNPGTSSFDTIQAANEDPLISAKLQFFMAISRMFSPFLKKYQTDEPVLPFLCSDLTELLMSLLRRFIQRELLQDITPLQLAKLDTNDQRNWVMASHVDISLGAESAIKVILLCNSLTAFSLHGKSEELLSFKPMEQRLDVFLRDALNQTYPELWSFLQHLLLLSHGQATVERGFSVNREVEACNIKEETIEAQRLVCDQVRACGGFLKVPLTKELLASVASARTRYRIYLEEERQKREGAMRGLKRKALEDELEQLKKKKEILRVMCVSLQKDADQLAEQAENKPSTLMAQMITKSNTLRKIYRDKCSELTNVESELASKTSELRHMH
nr:uncharacterized protein LOC129160142 [Nothobranchius furzeri]